MSFKYSSFEMEKATHDQTPVVPKTDRKQSSFGNSAPNPSRPMRFLMNRARARREKETAEADQEMKTVDEKTAHSPSTTYGYLAHIQSLKPLLTPQDKSLPKKVR